MSINHIIASALTRYAKARCLQLKSFYDQFYFLADSSWFIEKKHKTGYTWEQFALAMDFILVFTAANVTSKGSDFDGYLQQRKLV